MKHVCVVLSGNEKPTREWLLTRAKPLLVSPFRLRRALLWVKGHNDDYSDVEIDHDLLDLMDEVTLAPVHFETSSVSLTINDDIVVDDTSDDCQYAPDKFW